jgi:hypothetical protein
MGTNTIDLQDVTDLVSGAHGGSLTINQALSSSTCTDTAQLSIVPGRMCFYRVRLVPWGLAQWIMGTWLMP